MDPSVSLDISETLSVSDDISSIKKKLMDLKSEIIDVKSEIKNKIQNSAVSPQVGDVGFKTLNTTDDLIKFNDDISTNDEILKVFEMILEKIYSNHKEVIRDDMGKYFKMVLNSIFTKILFRSISWGKYGLNCHIKDSKIIQTIQNSGKIVDMLSTEFGRIKILQKEFNKCKDSKRARTIKSKPSTILINTGEFSIESRILQCIDE